MEYQFKDVLGLISYTIANYKNSLISRMNALGYSTPFNISNEALRDKMLVILDTEGLDKVKTILEIKINPTITTQTDKEKLSAIFKVDPTSKSLLDYLSDYLLPSSTTTGDTTTSTTIKEPVINKTALLATSIVMVVVIIIIWKLK